jgi:TatD DNase family protein
MSWSLVDTHSHLYVDAFNEDRYDMLKRCLDEKVEIVYLPAIDSETHQPMFDLAHEYPGFMIPMIGLHPCSVKENFADELKIVEDWLEKEKVAAIGEIGLDFYWDRSFDELQLKAFHYQCALALQHQLPIVIHSRESTQECIEAVKQYAIQGLTGIFHCFSGSLEQAQEITDMGFLLGIGGVVTYKKSNLPEIVEKIDLKYIVLETDSPYLSPVPYRGKRNESAYLKYVAEKVAEIKQLSIEEVANITSQNAKNIFVI